MTALGRRRHLRHQLDLGVVRLREADPAAVRGVAQGLLDGLAGDLLGLIQERLDLGASRFCRLVGIRRGLATFFFESSECLCHRLIGDAQAPRDRRSRKPETAQNACLFSYLLVLEWRPCFGERKR
ncbi:MAG: hypothetical protein AABZ20_01820 [candidate division NC10 bacterium]